MTRINLVPPSELTGKHLLAEYRELPRVFALSRKWWGRPNRSQVPPVYSMGKGHVTFFYDKLLFVHKRWLDLITECEKRGYQVRNKPDPEFISCDHSLYNDYTPTQEAIKINKDRIEERLSK